MPLPRPSQEVKTLLATVMPDNPFVQMRPMFGNVSGFINGNMFLGLFGDQIFVRLSEKDREELLAIEGASKFSPMPGRPMKEYVVLPDAWKQTPEQLRVWIQRSYDWAETLPEKQAPKKKPKKENFDRV